MKTNITTKKNIIFKIFFESKEANFHPGLLLSY
jgi:hypothetical protein